MKKPASKKKKQSKTAFVFKTIGLIALFTLLICGAAFFIYLKVSIDPKLDIGVETMKLNYTSTVCYLDSEGNEHELERLYSTQNRTWVDLENMPKYLKDAAIAIEDERFEKHHGVDWKRTAGAAVNLFFRMRSDFGGSTITQQLVKNLTGDKQDTVRRKLQEIERALYIERHYTKDTIIELYLNTIYLSQGCYGVSTAAEVYFDKDVSQLSLAECASLIGITNLPTYYDPFVNPENNIKRQRATLKKMLELGRITQEEYDAAIQEELVFKHEKRAQENNNKQSYFVDQIITDVIRDLMDEQGLSYQVAEKMIYSGGLKIYATIDPNVQAIMDEYFKNADNFPTYKGSVQPECAMVVMDPYTGEVRGMVGGRGEKTQNRGWNRATQTFRQPGSSIKPIAVYAPAIEYGLINPQSAVDDTPFSVLNGKAYPKNETRTYQGRMNATQALMESINTVSVKLLDELTPERSYNFMTTNLGFSKLDREKDKNLAPLALGGLTKGVSTLEMAAAYSAFPNKGTYIEPHTYTKILDNQGNVLLENKPEVVDAMSEKTAGYMNYMLGRVMSRGGTGNLARLDNDMPAAGKTGTTDNDKDRWYVGYTPYYSAAVWFGYDKPRYIESGLSPALTTWKKIMNAIHKNLPKKDFDSTKDLVEVNVCACSGLLPNEYCSADPRGSKIVTGRFYKDDVPTERCNVHIGVELDSVTMQQPTEFCPEEQIKTFGLLSLSRFFPLSGIVVGDDQYVIYKNSPSSGEYYFSSASKSNVRQSCVVHTTAPEPEEPEQPEQPEQPENPDDTNAEQPPSDNTSPSDTENPDDTQKPDDSQNSGGTTDGATEITGSDTPPEGT